MRLGGFVIHGNAVGTLSSCLDSLIAVCDEVVAVDSGSTDGSSEAVLRYGVRPVRHPWRGYGAARAAGARALAGCDWLLFLDSDESLASPAIAALASWKRKAPQADRYRLTIRDWADLDGRRFLFRTERHVRLVRADQASWSDRMIVHEALSRERAAELDVAIEHRFATSLAERRHKDDRYALLWALRAHAEGCWCKPAAIQRVAHFLRDGLLKGALLRGGLDACRLAWAVSRYHARKYQYLAELRRGLHAEKVEAFAYGRYEELF